MCGIGWFRTSSSSLLTTERLDRADVILGMPWFYDKQDTLYIDYKHHSLTFVKQDFPHVSISLCNQVSINNGFPIPVVSAIEMFTDMKSSYVDFYSCFPQSFCDSFMLGTHVTEFRMLFINGIT